MNPNEKGWIRRFTPIQRLSHLMLILLFLAQGATGLARLYIETAWGRSLAGIFGGYATAGTIHKVVGILMLLAFSAHFLYMLAKIDWKRVPRMLLEPDSLVPNPRDIKDFFLHIGWFLHVTKAPRFDRWGYWEKFDYWAVFWGIPVLGITGLLLISPVFTSLFFPGWVLNVALWVHRIESILAMAHVFIIHFFIGHLRRHSFPMDLAMFEGAVSLESARHEKGVWIERLESSGKLRQALVPRASRGFRAACYFFGYAAMATGLFLLIGGLLNSTSITW